jgi:outer membrane lipoprotein-sorting protein
MRTTCYLISSVFMAATTTLGQIQPAALDLANRVSKSYSRVSQYQLEMLLIDKDSNDSDSILSRISRKGQKYRLDSEVTFGSPTSAKKVAETVFDGVATWVYNAQLGTYSTRIGSVFGSDDPWIGEFRDVAGEFRRKGGTSMNIAGEERITIGPGDVRVCLLLELKYPQMTVVLSVDKRSSLIFRLRDDKMTYEFRKIELNKQIPDTVFKFTPPAGSRKVD